MRETKSDGDLLRAGDKLPTAREVVEATAINPNTVLKAYRELERDGLVEARRGLGTFVRRGLSTAPADSPLRTELDGWAVRAQASSSSRRGESAGAAPSVLRTKVPRPRLASTRPSRSSSR